MVKVKKKFPMANLKIYYSVNHKRQKNVPNEVQTVATAKKLFHKEPARANFATILRNTKPLKISQVLFANVPKPLSSRKPRHF